MAVALLIVRGPYVGQQIPIEAGQTFRIGRTQRSEYPFPNDTYLSGAHFEVSSDGVECHIRDLGSSNGTFVNGAKIDVVVLHEGDQVAAGESVFLVQTVSEEQIAAVPAAVAGPPAGVPLPAIERTARMFAAGFEPKPQEQPAPLAGERKRVLHLLTRQGAALFTVLDMARDSTVAELLQSSGLRYQPLFDSAAADPIAPHVPALVALGQTGSAGVGSDAQAFLDALLRSGWGKGWGIFCTSHSSFEDLVAHFRGFLLVRTSEQSPLYFRFYDPRVLRAFLPTCEAQELRAIFGPMLSYLVESENPETMLAFSPGADGLITARVSLTEQLLQAQAGGVAP